MCNFSLISKGELGLHALVLARLDDLFGLVVALLETSGSATPASVELSDILVKLSAMEAETDGLELVLRDELIESVDAVEVGGRAGSLLKISIARLF